MMTEREQFLVLLANQWMAPPDVIVVLMGEDAVDRMMMAANRLLQTGRLQHPGAILLSGGVHGPPRHIDAEHGVGTLLGMGVAPIAIGVEPASKHTAEQARNVVRLALENKWGSVMLVGSAYHIPRAFLTFVHELRRVGLDRAIYVVNGYVRGQSRWWGAPPGMTTDRIDLLDVEAQKIETYRQHGDVATFAEALEYLRFWEDVLAGNKKPQLPPEADASMAA